jgi:hypothetical protein
MNLVNNRELNTSITDLSDGYLFLNTKGCLLHLESIFACFYLRILLLFEYYCMRIMTKREE